jgi:hypothetical protein
MYRWFQLLNRLYEEATSDDSSKGRETKTPGINISKLTLPQVEELVNVNLPDISEAERLLPSFTLPSIGVSLDITSTTLFVEIGLLLLSSYFWIWYREARLSPNFPASGTLFGALARSASSRFMFSLLIALPPIAAALVALRTVGLSYWNVFLAILVTIVALLIERQGKLISIFQSIPEQLDKRMDELACRIYRLSRELEKINVKCFLVFLFLFSFLFHPSVTGLLPGDARVF